LKGSAFVQSIETSDSRLRVIVKEAATTAPLIVRVLEKKGIKVLRFETVEKPTLEDVFIELVAAK